MPVVLCGVVPHPPIAVPEVGKSEAQKVKDTQQAMLQLGERIKNANADVLVIVSPHAPLFADAIVLNKAKRLKGNLANFAAPEVKFDYANDHATVEEIVAQCNNLNLPAAAMDERLADEFDVSLSLDHGVTVPLYFLRQSGVDLPLVVASMSLFSFEQLYRFGQAVDRAAEVLNKKIVLLASGDLSHRLTPDAPAGYQPDAADFDREIVRLVEAADAEGLIGLDLDWVERAAECGLRSIIMVMGALEGKKVQSEVLSYEGPFGVGYMVAVLKPLEPDAGRLIGPKLEKQRQQRMQALREKESFPVRLARKTLENYVLGLPEPEIDIEQIPAEFRRRAAVFVTIKKNGNLRGCIGTVYPQYENIVEEIKHNAISAGIHDPRFKPVQPAELEDLIYSVDILSEPEPVSGIEQLDPKKYGVIVRKGPRSGLLLPNIEGVETAEQQVDIAKQKAGIQKEEAVDLLRFEVVRYK